MSAPVMPCQPTITARALKRSFQTGAIETPVLRGVTLDIFPGELTLIMGPSGSGKSTLLAVLSGLLKPDHGEVRVLDNDLTVLNDDALDRFRLQNCGFIFQGFNLFSALTALEQVLLVLQYADVTGAAAQMRAEQALAEVDLTPRATLRPLELSGGEKQRVAIARSLVKNPPLLFADEPTSALDSHNGERVIALLHHAARVRNATIVIVTHDPRLLKHADRVLHLEDGVITRDQRTPMGSRRGAQATDDLVAPSPMGSRRGMQVMDSLVAPSVSPTPEAPS